MTQRYGLLISVGPVQEFILQARRMRDLWFGSHMLSEIAKAIAKALVEDERVTPIYPAYEKGDASLEPSDEPYRKTTSGECAVPNVGNKIVCLVCEESQSAETIHALAQKAFDTAQKRLEDFAEKVWKDHKGICETARRALWDEQIRSFLELTAVWSQTSFEETDHQAYKAEQKRLERALASRKQLRDFAVWSQETQHGAGLPKSSFDGGRSSVLRKKRAPKAIAEKHRKQDRGLRINDGEQLDAVGLLKRGGGEPEQFVPLGNIALSTWIETTRQHVGEAVWKALLKACETPQGTLIEEENRAFWEKPPNIPRVRNKLVKWTEHFPYDANLFREDRWASLMEDEGFPVDNLRWFEKTIRDPILLQKSVTSPPSYVACLVADGDRMGAALDALPRADAQRRFSGSLSEFAEEARQIVQEKHRGILVYAGGDDVLAFVCVEDALSCAEELRQAFSKQMKKAWNETLQQLRKMGGENEATQLERRLEEEEEPEPKGKTQEKKEDAIRLPTLSVGIGIGHVMESMGSLLDLGREAEKLAKGNGLPKDQQRNALGIIADKRSGGTERWRSRWTSKPVDSCTKALKILGEGRLSGGKIYEIRNIVQRLPKPTEVRAEADQGAWSGVLRQEVERALRRSEGRGGAVSISTASGSYGCVVTPKEVGLCWPKAEDYSQTYKAVERWIEQMLILRLIREQTRRPHPSASASPTTTPAETKEREAQ